MEAILQTCPDPNITLEDWQHTPPSVRQMVLHVLERLAALEEERGGLRVENARLREQTRRSAHNSSQPPSSDAPRTPPRPPRQSRGRKRGAQPGHAGHQRTLYPVEQCRSVHDHLPTQCSACGTALAGDDPHPVRHQVVELPEVRPLVDEHRLHQLTCPECHMTTRATLPPAVPARGYGPRLAATVGWLSGPYRQSERQTQQALADCFHVDVALGTVNNLRQEVSTAVADPVTEATGFAQAQEVANADATGGVQGNGDGANPQRRKAWLWVLVTTGVTMLQIHLTRGQAAATQVLGTCAGILITDRWTGYGWLPLEQRQLCWAHLIREFHKIAERDEESPRIGVGLLDQAHALFRWWHRVRDGTRSRAECAAAVGEMRVRIQQWLAEGAAYHVVQGDTSVRAKTARTCRARLKVEPALWLFVHLSGVEPTNNAAERALRPAVIWRRTSLGTQSASGSQFVARLLTVTLTLRSQQRNV